MTIHREGINTILVVISFNLFAAYLLWAGEGFLSISLAAIALIILFLVLYFFRLPKRELTLDDTQILAPCDGTVVVVEEVQSDEYFTDKRLQVSIFMSVLNVHVNRNPIAGKIVYSKYHKGKHLAAWLPKSSSENERHSVVYQYKSGREILAKQVAGALAKRIVNYMQIGKSVKQGEEMGFIKFGSRVDLLLPLDAKLKVKLGDIAIGGVTAVAEWDPS